MAELWVHELMARPANGPQAQQPDSAATVNGALPGCRYLVFKRPWPSMMRTLAGNHERFEQTYFDMYRGYYFTGVPCSRQLLMSCRPG